MRTKVHECKHAHKRLKDLYFRHSVFSRPLVQRTLDGLFRTVAACPVRLLFNLGKRHGLCMPAQERVLRRSTAKTDKKEKQFGSHPCVGVSLAHAESPLRATIIFWHFSASRTKQRILWKPFASFPLLSPTSFFPHLLLR